MPGGGFLPSYSEAACRSERTVLHADLNSFFASVECARNPELAAYPVAVCGSKAERHGIVLAKNGIAKSFGVATGETIGAAQAKCPGLKIVDPHYDDYMEYSRKTREIYLRVTDLVESFGIDECWLDVTQSRYLFGGGEEIAEKLRSEVRRELGVTVSVGVSFCKVFAKLGSDMKKPDAVTVIPRETFRDRIWGLPASDMLGVGPATARKLAERSVHTIGELAQTPPELLSSYFGKCGKLLWVFANGLDTSPVENCDYRREIKSVGHGTTPAEDIVTDEEAESVIVGLSVDVGHRLRAAGLCAAGISVAVRDSALCVREFQARLPRPTQSSMVISAEAFRLYQRSYNRERPVRSLTVRAISLTPRGAPRQLDIFEPSDDEDKRIRLCEAVDEIRDRFGQDAILPANALRRKIKDFGYSACTEKP